MTTVNRRQLLASMGAAGLVRPAAAATEMKGKYFESAKLFVDTMVEKGTDRYGKKHTPLFCLSLDPETYMPPRAPEKIDMQYARSFEYLYRDFGYYWKSHLHSADPIYDQGTIRALYALSDAGAGRPFTPQTRTRSGPACSSRIEPKSATTSGVT